GISRLMRRMQDAGLPWDRLRLLLCRYNDRLAVHKEVRARLQDRFGTSNLLPVAIRNSVRLAEAPGRGQTIFQHAPSSAGATDYAELARLVRAAATKTQTKIGDAE
ncbi:MAG: ParA family protein, partial [Rhodobacteraceae bacterium]|nr:ParA family protein [Paracoccaceae bacterium]